MKVGVIGAGTMGQGIAKAFAQVDGYEVALCDIKQEWAEGGKVLIQNKKNGCSMGSLFYFILPGTKPGGHSFAIVFILPLLYQCFPFV